MKTIVPKTNVSLTFISLCAVLLGVGVSPFVDFRMIKSLPAQEVESDAATHISELEQGAKPLQPKATNEEPAQQQVRVLQDEVAYLTANHHHTELIVTEEKGQAMLGVHVRKASETLRMQLRIKGDFGLVIEHVTEGGAAATSLKMGDLLYRFDNQLLVNEEQLQALVDAKIPGGKVVIEFFRGGQIEKTSIELSQRKHSSLRAIMRDIEFFHEPTMKKFSHTSEAVKLLKCTNCHKPTSDATVEDLRLPSTVTPR